MTDATPLFRPTGFRVRIGTRRSSSHEGRMFREYPLTPYGGLRVRPCPFGLRLQSAPVGGRDPFAKGGFQPPEQLSTHPQSMP
jgi:hypothetical protein